MNAPLDQVLAAYRARLEALYGDRLKKLVLFGSRARGDAGEDSDVDVLIVLEGPINWSQEVERTGQVTSEVDIKYDVDISRAFATPDEYEHRDRAFFRNVRREGVSV